MLKNLQGAAGWRMLSADEIEEFLRRMNYV